jgi:ATP-dependent DNA helicase PIF1
MEMVVIDEVSMMGYKELRFIDERMQKIFNNDKPFGGKYVLLVGDFLQLPPIFKKPIFYQYSENAETATIRDLAQDLLWSHFKLHTLTKVMRQKNAAFIEVLRALSYGYITDDQILFIKKRECKPYQVPKEAVRLYYSNTDVIAFNNMRVYDESLPGSVIAVDSTDEVCEKTLPDNQKEKILEKFLDDTKIDIKIPKTLLLRVNIKYMIVINIDISDGLVNGAVGILKHITFDSEKKVQIVWIQFPNDKVGLSRRRQQIYRSIAKRENVSSQLVPIIREAVDLILKDQFGRTYSTKNKITRLQFPLYAAEAMTIHKSQVFFYKFSFFVPSLLIIIY